MGLRLHGHWRYRQLCATRLTWVLNQAAGAVHALPRGALSPDLTISLNGRVTHESQCRRPGSMSETGYPRPRPRAQSEVSSLASSPLPHIPKSPERAVAAFAPMLGCAITADYATLQMSPLY